MFNKRPVNAVRNRELPSCLESGYEAILSLIDRKLEANTNKTFVVGIDGTHGAAFDRLLGALQQRYSKQDAAYLQAASYQLGGEEIREYFKDNITDNRAFGYFTDKQIDSYFEADAKVRFAADLNKAAEAGSQMIVVIGTGAHWLGKEHYDFTLFADVSRELQQIKHKQGMLNFGFASNLDNVEKYKISLFVEWPILETYRKRHFSDFDYYLDMNDEETPVVTAVSDLITVIQDIIRYPLRVKPFFAPGIWGGQLLKEIADLPRDMVNCAWSFEPIAPENSILIGQGEQIIEIPFLIVMANGYEDILGKRISDLFDDYFPVRFDYLDTVGGSNLSCQVHGKQDFVRKHFNEFMEQQESYYIMEQEGDSKAYLGFTENTDKETFIEAVQQSQETGVPIDFTNYVQEWDCKKGDLFLIPTGTVHCSGNNNLVLEISSTTWWFTFKVYDYVRKDTDGKPRPINIDFAAENLDFHKKTDWVKENLIARPQLVREVNGNEEYLLGQRDDLLFYVRRIHLQDQYEDVTNGEFMMLNLVEGEKVRIVSIEDESVYVELNYAESYILPAVFGKFKLVNMGTGPCKLIKAGVSPNWTTRMVP
ncbi:class I mannose-6-phosphate isomerase [Paenibacillus glycanilyticus]|uniref:Mannose-6-phosphate isomerase n=1 Tax=Paenibacillus glycanilyticus TaxID=126569 RepID=A0ABQ6GBJ2_9BACL|nr:class I mannose-6-phosphate isomerase [Paenibacillus glycanilyticus]GLX66686.1 mannose-6-phosphate isomerase [Paenibacillus glycanilyticus]